MARLPRLGPADIPQHVIQRGNNRQVCFVGDQDFSVYTDRLKQYSEEFSVDIHAWVLMTNHVHLLVTPKKTGSVSKMMQALGRYYVRYFNRMYCRTGTLWEGRFKSNLVQTERYFLACQRYIELKPVRAAMVSDPGDYVWSSYQSHALGRNVEMWKPHSEYLNLGHTPNERQCAYRALLSAHVEGQMIEDIRDSLNKGLILGNDRFKDHVAELVGRRVNPAVMGRPRICE